MSTSENTPTVQSTHHTRNRLDLATIMVIHVFISERLNWMVRIKWIKREVFSIAAEQYREPAATRKKIWYHGDEIRNDLFYNVLAELGRGALFRVVDFKSKATVETSFNCSHLNIVLNDQLFLFVKNVSNFTAHIMRIDSFFGTLKPRESFHVHNIFMTKNESV